MKAVISNRIYMDCDAFMEQKLDEELTYTIPSYIYYSFIQEKCCTSDYQKYEKDK